VLCDNQISTRSFLLVLLMMGTSPEYPECHCWLQCTPADNPVCEPCSTLQLRAHPCNLNVLALVWPLLFLGTPPPPPAF
jgi:hypothetical protein